MPILYSCEENKLEYEDKDEVEIKMMGTGIDKESLEHNLSENDITLIICHSFSLNSNPPIKPKDSGSFRMKENLQEITNGNLRTVIFKEKKKNSLQTLETASGLILTVSPALEKYLEENTRDLGSILEETGQDCNFSQRRLEELLIEGGDGVRISSDAVWICKQWRQSSCDGVRT
ncbi:hypothetical protein Tco_0284844 [Tanacetum coccineum]